MDRQAKYKPQAENEFFADGRNDRPIPAGTVARGNYFNMRKFSRKTLPTSISATRSSMMVKIRMGLSRKYFRWMSLSN